MLCLVDYNVLSINDDNGDDDDDDINDDVGSGDDGGDDNDDDGDDDYDDDDGEDDDDDSSGLMIMMIMMTWVYRCVVYNMNIVYQSHAIVFCGIYLFIHVSTSTVPGATGRGYRQNGVNAADRFDKFLPPYASLGPPTALKFRTTKHISYQNDRLVRLLAFAQ